MKTVTLIILDTCIINAGTLLDHGDTLEIEGDALYPKQTIEGYSLQELEVEDDFNPFSYIWASGALTLKPPPEPTTEEKLAQADAIQSHIDELEKTSILNRGSRELELLIMEDRASTLATAQGITQAQVLTSIIYYVKLKALDTQIANLRAEMATLWIP